MSTSTPSERLAALGITLHARPAALDWQTPVAVDGDTLHVSGQVPFTEDQGLALTHAGQLAGESDVEIGRACARQCAIHLLAQLEAAAGDLSRVRMVRITVFVAAAPEFTFHSDVANAASDLLYEVLGLAGRHARSAIGVASLPLGSAVEIEAIARIED